MNNQQFERLVTNLQDVMRCPHCSSKYSCSNVSYLGQLDSMTFLHMTCSECNSPVFASVATSNEDGEIFTDDITAEDIAITETPDAQEMAYDEELTNIGFEQRSIDIVSDPEGLPPGQSASRSGAKTRREEPVNEAQEIPVEHIEAEKVLSALEAVSYNDVLDIHQYLDAFEGDFEKLMS